MTQSPHPQPDEPHAATADAAEPAGRAPGLIRRARAAARPVSSTGAFMTVIAVLATGLIGFVLRDLNSIEADINKLETEIDDGFAEVDARFVKLETEIDARFAAQDANIDARFAKLETDIDNEFAEVDERFDARFAKLETEMDARFDELEAGQQEIALTLVALVAYRRADEGVDAALAGRLPDPAAGPGTDPSP